MEEPQPFIAVVDTLIRVVLLLFLIFYAFRFRNLLVGAILVVSSMTLYTQLTLGERGLWLDLLSEGVAIALTYLIYEYMRMRHLLRTIGHNVDPMLSLVFEKPDEGHLGKDLNGIIVSWSHGAERLYGYKAEEIIGRNVLVLFPEDHEQEFDKIMRLVRHGKPYHYQTQRKHKDGHLVHVDVTVYPVRNPDGKIVGATTTIRRLKDDQTANGR